jgi:arginyl-tRNA synthetase
MLTSRGRDSRRAPGGERYNSLGGLMILDIQKNLSASVRAAVTAAYDVPLGSITYQYPPRPELGDLAITAPFDLAKALRRKPREIAERLSSDLNASPGVRKAEPAGGGYVNVFLERGRVLRGVHDRLTNPGAGPPAGARVIVEHTSINPNKAAHIGHLRNAVLGDTFVRVVRERGHEVGVQNYIDDTGVQVADVVVGFRHIEGKSRDEVRDLAAQPRFDYYCWDLYAKVGDFYAADPANKKLQAETLHEIEKGGNATADLAAFIAAAIVDRHLATMERLGIRYDLLAHESDVLRLHFWERAFALLKESGAIRLETDGKMAGCWVLAMGPEVPEVGDDSGTNTGRNAAGNSGAQAGVSPAQRAGGPGGATTAPPGFNDEDKVIVRSNGIVTYTGKDIAYQLWKLGLIDRDFRYRRHRTYPDGHVLWSTTSGAGAPDAPAFGHAKDVFNVIDVGQSYPQRVVKAGVAALGHPEGAAGSHHLAYEKVVLSPATARALGYAVADDGAVKVSGRKGLGVKADDLMDALGAKARAEIETRDPARDAAAREATGAQVAVGALRYFLLKFGRTKVITFDMDEALAFTGETGPYVQNAIVRARNIFARLEGDGHDVAALIARGRALDLDRFLEGEEGDEVWGLVMLMARSDETSEQVVRAEEVSLLARHAFAIAQAFHSYYQKPRYTVLRAESEDARAFRVLVVDAFVRQMLALTALLGIPVPDRM